MPARDPAITVHSLGRGQVVFFSTTANADWMSLPGKPAFTRALIHELLGGSVGEADKWMNLNVGDSLEIPPSVHLEGVPLLENPNHKVTPLETLEKEGQSIYRSHALVRPGLYRLVMVDPAVSNRAGQESTVMDTEVKQSIPIAVNVPGEDAVAGGASEADVRVVARPPWSSELWVAST